MRDGAWQMWRSTGLILVVVAASAGVTRATQAPGGPEVMARGPIHEAFASPIVYNPTPGAIVPKPPPSEPIEEQPPDQKPQGGDVEWITGYWAWDDERNDYLWISGIWRDIPPGRQWISGYWGQVEGGFRWTSGFWSPVATNGRLSYLPPPPQSLEIGPNTPPPASDFLWSPGSWAWAQDRYVWRPGFWVQAQPEWVWVPPSYVATPSGYLFVDGYWDYPVATRGMIFAPVAFAPAVLVQPAFVYTPSVVLSIGGLTANLFIRPSCGAYYFGDYYGYASAGPRSGYVPWFDCQRSRVGYDPLYASMAANHWREPQWDRQIRTEYVYRVQHVDARPAPTFEGQRAQVERRTARGEDVRGLEIAHAINRPTEHAEGARRMVPVSSVHRAEIAQRQSSVREVQQARARVESQGRVPTSLRSEDHRPQHLEVPSSPIASRSLIEPRLHEPARAVPPAHPPAHEGFRPTFQAHPHQEPTTREVKAEHRVEGRERTSHPEPRGQAEVKEAHREPKSRESEHSRPK